MALLKEMFAQCAMHNAHLKTVTMSTSNVATSMQKELELVGLDWIWSAKTKYDSDFQEHIAALFSQFPQLPHGAAKPNRDPPHV